MMIGRACAPLPDRSFLICCLLWLSAPSEFSLSAHSAALLISNLISSRSNQTIATMASAPVPPSFTNRATKLCAGCDNVKYCSVECQQAGWSHHKALCNTFKGFAETPSSGAQMRRFVAFILGEQKPRFMWAPVKDCMEYKSIEASGLAEVKHHLSQIPIQRNSWTEEPLGCAIMILHDDSFLAHYSDTNMAIVNATRGMSKYEWRGPLFAFCGHFSLPGEKGPVYGQECHRLDLPELYDMDMRSYAHLVAYLSDYSTKGAEGARYKGAKDDCVKVACKGDRLNGHPSHQVVCVPRTHPIFTGSGTASQISEVKIDCPHTLHDEHKSALTILLQRLDIPLLTWRYPSSQESTENPHFNFMHVSCDPKAASEDYEISRDNSPFGWAPMRYQNNVGT